MILTEVHPLESLPRHRQFPTAKAALTPLWPRTRSTARLCSNFQAVLDLRSGILHAEDTDYTTASSYFFERFEKLSAQGMRSMLFCGITLNLPEDVNTLLTLQDMESMRAVARVHQNRNLADFEEALREYKDELLRIIEPYSVVEIEHVAELVGQERPGVESKYEVNMSAIPNMYMSAGICPE
ncbi:hypothetical protein DFP72DRAFT_991583 [Ephemerocybe angulata]|uniref:Uncharacterized protein n=1 Tax=Ephemerocybe angulata TaxID=980116 RepID=A0A8H6HRU9_9AGAR|nr:hypothetical protein DFP72DRAFT_991583 [Tulosesus angulatus]